MGELLQVNVRQMQINAEELQFAQQKIEGMTTKGALTVSQVKRVMLGIDLHVDDMRRYFLQHFADVKSFGPDDVARLFRLFAVLQNRQCSNIYGKDFPYLVRFRTIKRNRVSFCLEEATSMVSTSDNNGDSPKSLQSSAISPTDKIAKRDLFKEAVSLFDEAQTLIMQRQQLQHLEYLATEASQKLQQNCQTFR